MSIWGSRSTAGITTAVLAALWAGGAAAQTLPAPPLPDLVARAERVVVSEVVEVRTERRQTRDGEMPITLVVLGVDQTLKGAPSVQLLLELPGGEAPGISGNAPPKERLEIVGLPRFQVGDRDVLFLSATGSLSPVVGFNLGRYRVQADGTGNVFLTTPEGRAMLSEDGHPISLKAFEALVGRLVSGAKSVDSDLPAARMESTGSTSTGPDPSRPAPFAASLWSAPLATRIGLGASPALLNGCPGWTCVAARALEPFGAPSPRGGTATGNDKDVGRVSTPAGEHSHVGLNIMWATDVFGRTMDELTPAVTIRREIDGQRTVTVFLNRSLAWNAYEGAPRTDDAGRPLLDLERILAGELRQVFELAPAAAAPASAGTTPGHGSVSARQGEDSRFRPSASRQLPGSEETGVHVRALAPCDPDSGVMSNPRMLTFQSPDDWAMSGYQVGFFREGASSAERTVDLGREAFLLRRVVDLPSSVAATIQQSFVTMIRTAGLTTPNGVVYTYRVRGIWAGGTTAWSEPSEPFVTCPG